MQRMGLQRYPAQKFGGLNTVTPPYDLDPGEAAALRNVRYPAVDLSYEAIEQRKGLQARTNSWSNGAQTSGSGIEIGATLESQQISVVAAGKDLWSCNPIVSAPGSLTRIYDSALAAASSNSDMDIGTWYFALVSLPTFTQPKIYMVPASSAENPQLWDGISVGTSVWTITGVPGPTAFFRSLVYWRGRLVATTTDQNRVYYSNTGDPNTWGNFIDIFDDTGSANIELVVHRNNLYLIKQHSVWMIYDPNTFANRLISNEGSGTQHRHIAITNPVDQRLYVFNAVKGLIYSTNGESDWVTENYNTPLPIKDKGAIGSAHVRPAIDPTNGSTLFLWGESNRGDRIEEIPVMGKPGAKNILRHTIPSMGGMWNGLQVNGFNLTPAVFLGTGAPVTPIIYDAFGQDGRDDTSPITSFWEGGWMPMISEEPWERIRRVSAIARGNLTIKIYSEMDTLDGAAPALTWTPAAFNPGTFPPRQFQTTQGPNKRGRYHKIRIEGSGVGGQTWGLSALEMAIRGGKSKK